MNPATNFVTMETTNYISDYLARGFEAAKRRTPESLVGLSHAMARDIHNAKQTKYARSIANAARVVANTSKYYAQATIRLIKRVIYYGYSLTISALQGMRRFIVRILLGDVRPARRRLAASRGPRRIVSGTVKSGPVLLSPSRGDVVTWEDLQTVLREEPAQEQSMSWGAILAIAVVAGYVVYKGVDIYLHLTSKTRYYAWRRFLNHHFGLWVDEDAHDRAMVRGSVQTKVRKPEPIMTESGLKIPDLSTANTQALYRSVFYAARTKFPNVVDKASDKQVVFDYCSRQFRSYGVVDPEWISVSCYMIWGGLLRDPIDVAQREQLNKDPFYLANQTPVVASTAVEVRPSAPPAVSNTIGTRWRRQRRRRKAPPTGEVDHKPK